MLTVSFVLIRLVLGSRETATSKPSREPSSPARAVQGGARKRGTRESQSEGRDRERGWSTFCHLAARVRGRLSSTGATIGETRRGNNGLVERARSAAARRTRKSPFTGTLSFPFPNISSTPNDSGRGMAPRAVTALARRTMCASSASTFLKTRANCEFHIQ